VFSLQGKDASELAGNWFQLLMFLFTKKYLATSVLCNNIYLKMETYPISETRCVERQKTDDCQKDTKDVYPHTDDTS
jgi:hypothetical protein